MSKFLRTIKPRKGFSEVLHILLVLLLPAAVFLTVAIDLGWLGFLLVILAKWRIFTVRPRYWFSLVRANMVDLIVGLSMLAFMVLSPEIWMAAIVGLLYGAWLVFLKPFSDSLRMSVQAAVGQTVGLVALFWFAGAESTLILALSVWAICYFSAYHFFLSFEEQRTALYSLTWAYVAGVLTWILSHWLLFFGVIAQIALLLTAIGFGIGGLYILQRYEKLSDLSRRQVVFTLIAILIVIVVISSWDHPTLSA